MKVVTRVLVLLFLLAFAVNAMAAEYTVVIPKGTFVTLVFDQAVESKTAKVGDVVRMHVLNSVVVNGKTVIKSGTPERALISEVDHAKRFGVSAKLRLALNPVKSVYGVMVPLEARSAGKMVNGKTGAVAGGTAILGPVGLVGGYFVHGKRVHIKPGDRLETLVSKDIAIRVK